MYVGDAKIQPFRNSRAHMLRIGPGALPSSLVLSTLQKRIVVLLSADNLNRGVFL
jgi:hypothetical protein